MNVYCRYGLRFLIAALFNIVPFVLPSALAELPGSRATVENANADFARRKEDILRGYANAMEVARLSDDVAENGLFPPWNDKGGDALRFIGAGLAIFSDAEYSDLQTTYTGDGKGNTFREMVDNYLLPITQYEDVGTHEPQNPDNINGAVNSLEFKNGGDYDFTLIASANLILQAKDHPDLISNNAVRALISHGKVQFNETPQNGVAHCEVSGLVPFAGPWTHGLITGPFLDDGRSQKLYSTLTGIESLLRWRFRYSIPETENHLFQMYTWRYLVQEYLAWVAQLPKEHPRYDLCLKNLYEQDSHYSNDTPIADTGATADSLLYLMLRRTFTIGLFETNARPYQSLTLNSLLTLHDHADALFSDPRRQDLKRAAAAALDYMALEFALQSFEGKRLPPMRRNIKHTETVAPYASDYVPYMWGTLTGAYIYDDTVDTSPQACDAELYTTCEQTGTKNRQPCSGSCPVSKRDQVYNGCRCSCTDFQNLKTCTHQRFQANTLAPRSMSQAAGYSLWSALSEYRVPAAIQDWMLNKHNGYWARIQSKYSLAHYALNYSYSVAQEEYPYPVPSYPLLSEDYGVYDDPVRYRPVFQYYFAGKNYLNTAGGFHSKYVPTIELKDPLPDREQPELDAFSKPYSIIGEGLIEPKSDIVGHEKYWEALANETILMPGTYTGGSGGGRFLDTYKSFSYGYFNVGSTDIHLNWPQYYPAEWDDDLQETFGIGRAGFKIFEFNGDHPLRDNYLILAQFSKSQDIPEHRHYARGFWEVVPKDRFYSAAALRVYIETYNAPGNFNNNYYTSPEYHYTMTTGETLTLNDKVGSSAAHHGILEIRDSSGTIIPFEKYAFPRNYTDHTMPVLEAWEVDENYNFLEESFARVADGKLFVSNPYTGTSHTVDWSTPNVVVREEEETFVDPLKFHEESWQETNQVQLVKTAVNGGLQVCTSGSYGALQSIPLNSNNIYSVGTQLELNFQLPQSANDGWVSLVYRSKDAPLNYVQLGFLNFNSATLRGENTRWLVDLSQAVQDHIIDLRTRGNLQIEFVANPQPACIQLYSLKFLNAYLNENYGKGDTLNLIDFASPSQWFYRPETDQTWTQGLPEQSLPYNQMRVQSMEFNAKALDVNSSSTMQVVIQQSHAVNGEVQAFLSCRRFNTEINHQWVNRIEFVNGRAEGSFSLSNITYLDQIVASEDALCSVEFFINLQNGETLPTLSFETFSFQ